MLSLMAKEFFSSSPVLMFPIAALILFFVAFTVLTIKAMRKPSDELAALAGMPLIEDDTAVEDRDE